MSLNPPPAWAELSPLGKIPVPLTGELDLVDSSVICQYLERVHPTPALYPSEPAAFARALWLEELVDGGLAPHVLGGLYGGVATSSNWLSLPTQCSAGAAGRELNASSLGSFTEWPSRPFSLASPQRRSPHRDVVALEGVALEVLGVEVGEAGVCEGFVEFGGGEGAEAVAGDVVEAEHFVAAGVAKGDLAAGGEDAA